MKAIVASRRSRTLVSLQQEHDSNSGMNDEEDDEAHSSRWGPSTYKRDDDAEKYQTEQAQAAPHNEPAFLRRGDEPLHYVTRNHRNADDRQRQ